jgi:hypothetical protein
VTCSAKTCDTVRGFSFRCRCFCAYQARAVIICIQLNASLVSLDPNSPLARLPTTRQGAASKAQCDPHYKDLSILLCGTVQCRYISSLCRPDIVDDRLFSVKVLHQRAFPTSDTLSLCAGACDKSFRVIYANRSQPVKLEWPTVPYS